jgi:hypothetical protein
MRYTEDLTKGQRTAQEKLVRRVVREEIVNALGALAREAISLDMPYGTGELESAALSAIGKAADGAVERLTCPHEEYYTGYGRSRCSRCGEPEPEPVNPFEGEECNHAYALEDSPSCLLCGSPYPRPEGIPFLPKETHDGTS